MDPGESPDLKPPQDFWGRGSGHPQSLATSDLGGLLQSITSQ